MYNNKISNYNILTNIVNILTSNAGEKIESVSLMLLNSFVIGNYEKLCISSSNLLTE